MKKTDPLRNEDGSLKQFLLNVAGTSFRCHCGCNVFHKPDRERDELYECNSCEKRYLSS